MKGIQQLENIVQQVRRDILRMVHKVNSGHPGGSLGCAEFFVVLYKEIMEYNTDFSMDGIDEDLFFLSNGHISPVYYSVLARSGFFPVEELNTFAVLSERSNSLLIKLLNLFPATLTIFNFRQSECRQ